MKDNTNRKQKDWNVELLRILACCIVIGTHIKLNDLPSQRPGNIIDASRTMIGSFFGEGVTIFFLIMGFFFLRSTSFKKVLKRTVVVLLIPMMAYLLFYQIFHDWIMSDSSMLMCLKDINIDYKNIIKSITTWSANGLAGGQHLWYVFSYVEIVLWFPLLRFLNGSDRNEKYARRFIIVMGLASQLVNDIQKLYAFPWGESRIYALVPDAILIVLIGYEIYQKKNFFEGKWYAFIGGLTMYLLSHIALFKAQMTLYYRDINSRHVFSWQSIFAIIGAVSITICILSIKSECRIIKNIVCFMGDKTYYIYLIHGVVFHRLDKIGIREKLLEINCSTPSTFKGELAYTLEYVVIIFMVSMIVSAIIKGIIHLIKISGAGIKKVSV